MDIAPLSETPRSIAPLTFADASDMSTGAGSAASADASGAVNGAFGLGFEDLLRIVLTQLTYQDPLKPMDNAEFVSQLAQFSQIQQTQTMSDRLLALLQATATTQATSLLNRIVDIPSGTDGVLSGRVTSISFQSGEPRVTIETPDHQTISGLSLSSISRIAVEQ